MSLSSALDYNRTVGHFRSFVVYPTLSVLLVVIGWQTHPSGELKKLLLVFFTGALGWTALEYVLHRFVFHSHSSNASFKKVRQKLHLVHHAEPMNLDHLFVSLRFSLPISALFFGLFFVLTRSLLSTAVLLSGLWAGFLYYEAVHYRLHLTSSHGPFLDRQRRRHFHHHFVDGDCCFGVTSPLWDILLRSDRRIRRS